MGARRWFIYVPEIDPETFVFFFYKGNTGRSWTLRSYASGFPVPRLAKEFPWTADQVLEMARRDGSHAFPAATHTTDDIAWYQEQIRDLNDRYLGGGPAMDATEASASSTTLRPEFPILDLRDLLAHPKASKTQDLRRMYTSPQSEDWVTWTAMKALARRPADEWWGSLVNLAESILKPPAVVPSRDHAPHIELWPTVPSPSAYEEASRTRMAASTNPEWRARAEDPKAVEGYTEVDLVLDGDGYLVFVEAKLNSDISERTTYDPERNQIVRNVDCVIDQAGSRTPFFWMFVKDRAPMRLYSQLIDTYRRMPSELHRLLPHRDSDDLQAVVASLAVITWRELYPLLVESPATMDALTELKRRI
jgi:hypothetical protein